MHNNKLLESYKKRNLDLKNRVVMAPMTRNRTRREDRVPTEMNVKYYEQRASAGLIITEGTHVSAEGIGSLYVPNIYTEKQVEGWKNVTKAVHKKGGVIFAQLWHVGRLSHPNLLNGNLPLAPSAINPNFKTYGPKDFQETVTPKAIEQEDIERTIRDYVQATLNAEKAGFNGVELHAANGYLFHQFFMQCSNTRKDNYGGSIENRARFLFDVLEAIAKVYPLEKVGVRLAPDLNHTFGIIQDENSAATFDYIFNKLNNYPLAYVHISGFSLDKNHKGREQVLATARKYRKIYKGTLMINKGFDAKSGHYALEEGIADLISFGVPFISNPDLVERIRENHPWAIPDRNTFYGGGAEGYIDYPTMKNGG